ncbi:MAG: hypothetical protein ACR2RB_14080 [Gammaproteobacteria bacterium]
MIKELFEAFRTIEVPEDKAIAATEKLTRAVLANEAKLDFVKWGIVALVVLAAGIAVRVWFFPVVSG